MSTALTLFDKLWAAHEILRREDGDALLWVDRHYIHEGSFHAFGKLAERGVTVAEPGLTFGVADHYVPTRGSRRNISNPEIARILRQVEENTAKHGIRLFGLDDRIYNFTIDPVRRMRLLNGWDDIALTENYCDRIAAFKERDRAARPWAIPRERA
jgi:hypothetical protein